MNKRCRLRWARLLLIAVFVFASTSSTADSPVTDCATALRLDVKSPKSDAKGIVRFKGRHENFASLLRELSRESAACGTSRPVYVLVSDRQPLALLHELRGLLSKAGLNNARYYTVSSQSGMMGEILFGNVVAYPEDP